jgi:4-amino-4-deoxy-L-arabinose transferase-like glycosyltransferase
LAELASAPAGARVSRAEWLSLTGIGLLALVLRATGATYGLPYALLNPDEESIVPRAWRMVHGGGLDPGWFDYPTLLMYLVAPGQVLAGHPSYGAARLVAVAIGIAGVAAVWWLGRQAYGRAAGLIGAAGVAVATTHVAYSRLAVTDVLLTALVTAALALAVTGRLELAGMAVGLAASAKYPGVIAAVPVLLAGIGQWRRLGASAASAVLAFALTSPFVVIHAGAAWDDISRVQRLARAGWLGFENDSMSPLAFTDRLWTTLGPVLAVSAAGIVVALARRTRTDLVLLSFLAAYFVYLLPLGAHFDRYVLPLVPVLAVLAGRIPALALPAALMLVVPLLWSVADAHDLTRTDTRSLAEVWLDDNVAPGTRVALDPSTVPLQGRAAIRLELPGPGRPADPRRDLERLRALGVEFVVVSGAVTDRVVAARARYPLAAAFYDRLSRDAAVVFAADPDQHDRGGPWVRVFRL